MTNQKLTPEQLKALIADNRDMLGRRYYDDISYIPTESDMSELPVKSTIDFPEWNVRSAPIAVFDGCVYFAGPDGFVWYCPEVSEIPDQSYFDACGTYCVAAYDLWFFDADDPDEAECLKRNENYGWYLARSLSDLHYRMNSGNTDK
jgi:hypothetical protein